MLQDSLGATMAHDIMCQEPGNLFRPPIPVQDSSRWIGNVGAERQQVRKLTEYFRIGDDRHH